ncbi:MAG: SPOR domain-containing protein [Sulfuriflexus sp.]|nr:SPOR domain-containing protein [Sulfuriflexus sp.]
MARKMAKKNKSKSTPLPGWVWMATGLFIGLFVAFLVHLKDNYPALSLPATEKTTTKQSRDTRDVRKTPAAPKTQFDFYTILPEMEIAIPDSEASSSNTDKNAPFKHDSQFILQAGSFKKLAQADQMKASLALLGVQAKIQSVTINNPNKGASTWHRVRLGPYDSFSEMNRIRSRLRRNNIEALLLKLKS